jgi:small conductance mechanosensitive channel
MVTPKVETQKTYKPWGISRCEVYVIKHLGEQYVKTVIKTLLILLLSTGASGVLLAQDKQLDESQNVTAMIAALNADIADLEFLNAQLASAEKVERELLVYRQDERSFRLLKDFDTLVAELQNLPEGSTQRTQVTTQLALLGDGVGDAIFKRIEEIKQRIIGSNEKLASMSGGELVAAQAQIQNLESIRVKYYQSLVRHLDSREYLGLSSENLRNKLDPNLNLYAEALTGQIELTGAALREVRGRAKQYPDNADISAALIDLGTQHKVNLGRLQAIIPVLDSLGLDSSDYKAVMLQQSSSISVSFFSSEAIFSVLKDGWKAFKTAAQENAPDVFFRIFMFLAVLFVFRLLSRMVRRVVRVATERSSLDMSELLKNILVSTIGGTIMGLGVLMALAQVGISLAPMLAGLGVAGFIVGFALQDTLGNFAAGAMILIYRPFDVNDFVEVTGASGLVKKMNLVSTTITTFDNQTLVVPNSKIWGDVIKNVTAQTERRVDLEFGIGYDDDIELAERVLAEVVTSHEKILDDPPPKIKLHTLGDSSVNFIVRPWVKTGDYWDVYWDLMREVKLRFDREGITIPFTQRDVHLYTEKDAD